MSKDEDITETMRAKIGSICQAVLVGVAIGAALGIASPGPMELAKFAEPHQKLDPSAFGIRANFRERLGRAGLGGAAVGSLSVISRLISDSFFKQSPGSAGRE